MPKNKDEDLPMKWVGKLGRHSDAFVPMLLTRKGIPAITPLIVKQTRI